ncbi:MAG: hypothetical protein ACQEQL_00430 [Pseudomonadota bacterium]
MANVQKARLAVAEEYTFDAAEQDKIERSVAAMQTVFKPQPASQPSPNL